MSLILNRNVKSCLMKSGALALVLSLSACQTLEGFKRDMSGDKVAPRAEPGSTLVTGASSEPYLRVTGATLEENEIGYGLERGPRRYVEPTVSGPVNQRESYM